MKELEYKFYCFIMLFEALFIIFYDFFTVYDVNFKNKAENLTNITNFYPMYQDVHVMMFIGFGFLMVFLRQGSWQGVAFNFMIAAFVIQWSILNVNFFANLIKDEWDYVQLDVLQLIQGDFCSAAILISFGAVLGKVNAFQLLIMAFIETIFYSLNLAIGANFLLAVDQGGSIFIHSFGAYFGLAVSYALTRNSHKLLNHTSNKSGYQSNLTAMIGTIFLWIYWPSFNAIMASESSGKTQIRCVVNTVLSLTTSCLVAFGISSKLNHGKFEMEDILNATLAGGVIVGSSCDLIVNPSGAMAVGFIGGVVSTYGFRVLSPYLQKKMGLFDTCGVHNLHAMPGFLGGVISSIISFHIDPKTYGGQAGINATFPARDPSKNADPRGAIAQSIIQICALVMTVGLAIVTGYLTGLLISLPYFNPQEDQNYFNDIEHFELPKECKQQDHLEVPKLENNSGINKRSGSNEIITKQDWNIQLQKQDSKYIVFKNGDIMDKTQRTLNKL